MHAKFNAGIGILYLYAFVNQGAYGGNVIVNIFIAADLHLVKQSFCLLKLLRSNGKLANANIGRFRANVIAGKGFPDEATPKGRVIMPSGKAEHVFHFFVQRNAHMVIGLPDNKTNCATDSAWCGGKDNVNVVVVHRRFLNRFLNGA